MKRILLAVLGFAVWALTTCFVPTTPPKASAFAPDAVGLTRAEILRPACESSTADALGDLGHRGAHRGQPATFIDGRAGSDGTGAAAWLSGGPAHSVPCDAASDQVQNLLSDGAPMDGATKERRGGG